MFCYKQWDFYRKCGANTLSAADLNFSTHKIYIFLSNRHSQSGSLITGSCSIIFLTELVKYSVQGLLTHTNSGIRYTIAYNHMLLIITRSVFCNKWNAASVLCKFDCIADDVEQYFPDSEFICHHIRSFFLIRFSVFLFILSLLWSMKADIRNPLSLLAHAVILPSL